jgi:uncharacterized protein (DUF736 family)
MAYPQTISITVFPNDRKEKETSPDYSCSGKVGVEYKRMGSGWRKDKNGKKFLSLSLDVDVLKEMIMEKMNATNSDGSPVPNFDIKKEEEFLDF